MNGENMRVKTLSSSQAWQASDGSRTIWKVELAAEDGKNYQLQTYSAEIAKVGFEGEVESYVSPRGDKFVRQPKQEGGFKGKGGKGADGAIIKAQWAIGRAATIIQQRGELLPEEEYFDRVEELAVRLVAMAERVKAASMSGGSESEGLKATDRIAAVPDVTDAAAIERYMTATMAEMGTSND